MAGSIVAVCIAVLSILVTQAGAGQVEVRQFGGEGSGAGQLNLPGGIAVSPDGTHVFVADTGNDRIDEFTAEGIFVRAWGWGVADGTEALQTCTVECFAGQSGNRAGELNEPVGVAVGTDGSVYAIDRGKGDGRIQVFATGEEEVAYDGSLPAGYGRSGEGEADLTYPLPFADDVVVGPDKRIYVADNGGGGSRIFVFGTDRKLAEKIEVGSEPVSALTVGPDGSVYVAYGRDSVLTLGAKGERSEFETSAYGGITALAIRPRSGNILVEPNQSGEESKLLEYEPGGGKLLGEIPIASQKRTDYSAPGSFGLAIDPTIQFPGPEYEPGVAYGQGAIYVADRYAGHVSVLAERAPGEPRITAVAAAEAGVEGGSVSATIDPNGNETHLYFEYGTTSAYGSVNPTPPGADLGTGFTTKNVSVHLSGLQPNTTYHYAAVATSSAGTVTSADQTFTTFPVGEQFSLPDGRVWEQVSTEKGTSSISPGGSPPTPNGIAAIGGGAVGFFSKYPLPVSPSGLGYTLYAGIRGPEAWRTETVSAVARGESQTLLVSRDLSKSITVSSDNLTGDAPPTQNIFLRDTATGAVTLITPYLRSEGFSSFEVVGASSDFGRIFIKASRPLTPDAPGNGTVSLYEYSEGSLKDVAILPGASAPTAASVEGTTYRSGAFPVSESGSRVFFTTEPAPSEPGEFNAGQLFVRIDRDRTVEVSASQATVEDPEASEQGATFVAAAADGSSVFFKSRARLTDDADTGTPGDREPNLYRYDVETGALADLSVATSPADEELGAAVSGAVITADGDNAYFVATGNLAAGGRSGVPNLYRWTAGQGVRFVATLDQADPLASPYQTLSGISRVTADGSIFAFASRAALDPAFPSAAGTEEIYRYSAADGTITCVSCSRYGSRQSPTALTEAGEVGGGYGGNFLSADGGRIVFQTTAALVPEDVNGKEDVYEWENGATHLISAGTGGRDSNLIDVSPSGADIFFVTNDRLVPGDQDEYADAYDARIGGGLPGPPLAPPPCEGDGCRGSQGSAAAGPSIGSRSFNGPPDRKARHHRKKHKHRKHHKHAGHRKNKRSHGHPAVGKHG